MSIDEQIGNYLRNYREKNNYSMRGVAEKIGISHTYVSKIEGGKIPSFKLLDKLCKFYGFEIEHMLMDIKNQNNDMDYEWVELSDKLKRKLSPEQVEQYIDSVLRLHYGKGLNDK